MLNKTNAITFLISFLLYSCSNEPDRLENALIAAGGNRTELEKVLDHYSKDAKDSLKYKAACFLIENMPGHYSYKDTLAVVRFYNEVDSLADLYGFPHHDKRDSLYTTIQEKYKDMKHNYLFDVEFITAEYLINNIELSFDAWHNGRWATHIDFEEFCEYLLPYKVVETQLLDDWRHDFSCRFDTLVSRIYCDQHQNLANKACEAVNHDLWNEVRPTIRQENSVPVRRMSTLARVPYGTCEDYSILALSVMRAKGIPAAIDFTPQWPFRSMGHSWNVLLDNSGKNLVFEGAYSRPGVPHKEDHKMAKVFRRVYAINKEIEAIYRTQESIPNEFVVPFMKDVTKEYMTTCDIRLDFDNTNKDAYIYLAVFDNRNWVPVHWGKCDGNKATFTAMGRDIVYLPIAYEKSGIIPVSHPIVLTLKGEIRHLIPDTSHKQTIVLHRKYPILNFSDFGGMRMIGGEIQASNDPVFRKAITLHTLLKPTSIEDVRLPEDSVGYRYWRYLSPKDSYGNIAELAFFERDSIKQSKGKIIGTKGSIQPGETHKINAVFDGALLTFFDAPKPSGAWVGMDFGRKVKIGRVVCVARGDGNNIEIGDEYELLYWSENSWQTLGKKIADDYFLTYTGCPSNALFLLRNHTKGQEERIFTYENGRQKFW